MRQFTVSPSEAGMRITRFVEKATSGFPRTLLHKAFRNRRIKINGKRAQSEDLLRAGDIVELYINDEFFRADKSFYFTSENAVSDTVSRQLTAIFEDEGLAILHKPAGLLSHSGENGGENLLDTYIQRLIVQKQYLPEAENTFRPALCNRLDRNTEGLVVVAKTHAALAGMNMLIRQGYIGKDYRCICLGEAIGGTYEAFLSRNLHTKKVVVMKEQAEGSKKIITRLQPLASAKELSLCEAELITGRTHQLRAHMAFLGWPLLGDGKYGNAAVNRRFGLAYQCLCAHTLRFSETIPSDNPLAYLAGRVFSLQQCDVDEQWQRLNGLGS